MRVKTILQASIITNISHAPIVILKLLPLPNLETYNYRPMIGKRLT